MSEYSTLRCLAAANIAHRSTGEYSTRDSEERRGVQESIGEYRRLEGDSEETVQQQRGVKHTPPPGDHCWFSHKEERTKAAASCFEWIVIRWVQQCHFATFRKNNVKACFAQLRSHFNERKIASERKAKDRSICQTKTMSSRVIFHLTAVHWWPMTHC